MKPSVVINNLKFEELISSYRINEIVDDISNRISAEYSDREVLVLPVLNGAFMFAADVLRRLKCDILVEFIKVRTYTGRTSTGEFSEVFGLTDVKDKDILLIDDIVDTGFTLFELKKYLLSSGAKSVKIACFLSKPECCKKELYVDFVGKEVSNEFLVGYGLDYNGKGRTLPSVYKEIS